MACILPLSCPFAPPFSFSFSSRSSLPLHPRTQSITSTSSSSSSESSCSGYSIISRAKFPLPSSSHAPVTSPLLSSWNDQEGEAELEAASNTGLSPAVGGIVYPGLHNANIMWFNRPVNAQITVGQDESADSMVRRFRKAVMQAGVIPECRRRRFFESPQDKVKRKKQALRKRRSRFKGPGFGSDPFAERDISLPAAADDDDDNWDYEPNL
ncbi:hypothetical protein O6H91_15G041100 [Diphasiastrum complanatum]|uniref:Uncharacterized protein n=1 Tax=Diphasiastrum complanatum TaxID=34168 RepID=A0ACC2BII2_DIPCM|nr:hypothetical protein O6H91_15G041100 [Diphasiastrum complanatum]